MGLATAIAFARRGATLFLAARREEALAEAARACEAAGSPRAVPVVADVTDAAAMRALADRAAAEAGGIDLWVNMAGLGAVGRFEEIPVEVQARLLEVNLTGALHGCHAALPHMLRRGEGIIVNMSSIGGRIAQPFAAAYTASKFGLRGLTDSLRGEMLARSRIQVCGVYPQFVDTPAPLHAANYTGRTLRAAPPVLSPDYVAERIVQLCRHPRRALYLGSTHAMVPLFGLAPDLAGQAFARVVQRALFENGPPAPATDGAVLAPVTQGTGTAIGWGRAETRQMQGWMLGALGAAALGGLLLSLRR
jgi:NAD(P)-dependent dehydrogenase (short-subunit alcohol dehydrogenase family)